MLISLVVPVPAKADGSLTTMKLKVDNHNQATAEIYSPPDGSELLNVRDAQYQLFSLSIPEKPTTET